MHLSSCCMLARSFISVFQSTRDVALVCLMLTRAARLGAVWTLQWARLHVVDCKEVLDYRVSVQGRRPVLGLERENGTPDREVARSTLRCGQVPNS